jgi:excisionase family DNA binding protein
MRRRAVRRGPPKIDASAGPRAGETGSAAQILNVGEVAEYFKLPVSTVYRLAERRQLPGYKVGRQWRFQKFLLDDWFRRHAATNRSIILVVDDEPAIRELMAKALATTSRAVLTAGSGEDLPYPIPDPSCSGSS